MDSIEIRTIATITNNIPKKCVYINSSFKINTERISELTGNTLVNMPAELADAVFNP